MVRSTLKPKTIFFDFDGTLIDISERYYEVYRVIAKEYVGDNILPREEYWKKRCSGMSFIKLMGDIHKVSDKIYLGGQYRLLIEQPQFLRLDHKFKGIDSVLAKLAVESNIVLVCLRHNHDTLCWQLQQLQLNNLFDGVLSDADDGHSAHATKRRLIENSLFKSEIKYMVGDTEVDIEAGRAAGCITIAIASGIRRKGYLMDFGPDYLINNIFELPAIVNVFKIN